MTKLNDSIERVSKLRRSLSDVQVIADDLDDALKSASKVFTPKEVKAGAKRLGEMAERSRDHQRP